MEEDALGESINLIEEMPDAVYSPCSETFRKPNGWAKLKINMTLMSDEDRKKVYQAERLLKEAGVGFDSGSGCGCRDWELDWSLSGARVEVRPLACLQHTSPKVIDGKIHWTTYRLPTGRLCSYPYCSPECQAMDKQGKINSNWKVVFEEVSNGT